VGQETCQVEGYVAFAGFGLQSVLVGHHEIAQTVDHVVEHVRGNNADFRGAKCCNNLGGDCTVFAQKIG
jgi:hypothetical protein